MRRLFGTTARNERTARTPRTLKAALVGGVALCLCASTVAYAQSTVSPVSVPTRGGGHYGGGGGGIRKGIIGTLIGIGIGAAMSSATASEPEPASEEPHGRLKKAPKPRVVEAQKAPPKELRKVARNARPEPKLAASKGPKAPPKPVAVAAADPTIVPREVLFEVKPGTTDETVASLARKQKLDRISSERFELTGTTIYRYRIRDGRAVDAVVKSLSDDGRVGSAQPNHVFTLSGDASSLAATQFASAKMHLAEAHAVATGEGVGVAIIDSGVDQSHPALKDAIAETYDPVGAPYKPHAHGTAVAGLVAARGDIDSPAPAAKIYAIRAFSGEDKPAKPGAEGTTLHILRGLDWAAKKGVRVVNMSFAGPKDDKISQFIAAGAAKGEIHVAAAGNAGPSSPPLYPAADANVIAVTATDADDNLLKVANRGDYVSVAAPGVDVLVATPGGGYGYLSGTSMSSAEVSGVVALLAQGRPTLAAPAARDALVHTAKDLGSPGADPEFGAGEINARAAVDAVAGAPVAAADKSAQVTPPSAAPGADAATVRP